MSDTKRQRLLKEIENMKLETELETYKSQSAELARLAKKAIARKKRQVEAGDWKGAKLTAELYVMLLRVNRRLKSSITHREKKLSKTRYLTKDGSSRYREWK